MNTKNIILVALLFAATAGAGFFLTKQLKSGEEVVINDGPTPVPAVNDSISLDDPSHDVIPDKVIIDDVNSTPTPDKPANTVKLSVSTPVGNNGVYSFKASCSGAEGNYHYELWNTATKRLVQKSSDGSFSNIPANSSAAYKLALVDDSTGKVLAAKMVGGFKDTSAKQDPSANNVSPTPAPEKPKLKLISESDLQQRINRHDGSLQGGKKSPVDRNAKIETTGQKSDELRNASDLADIYEKMDFGKWKSVQVVEVDYNDKGVVTRIKVKPVY